MAAVRSASPGPGKERWSAGEKHGAASPHKSATLGKKKGGGGGGEKEEEEEEGEQDCYCSQNKPASDYKPQIQQQRLEEKGRRRWMWRWRGGRNLND